MTAGASSLPALVAENLRDTILAAAALVGAQGTRLQLVPELEVLRQKLDAAEIRTEVEPALAAADPDQSSFHVMAPRAGMATDLLDVGVRLSDGARGTVGLLILCGVPAAWQAQSRLRALEALTRVMERQIGALRLGPAVIADPMLRLLEELHDLDSSIVSQGLMGFVRTLAGKRPSQVECTAMRIVGLADVPVEFFQSREIRLSVVAQDLLDAIGYGAFLKMGQAMEAPEVVRPAPRVETRNDLEPFARLRLIERDFLVAEDADCGAFWFREAGQGPAWKRLSKAGPDGWAVVAAEILELSSDVVAAFAGMHLLRRPDLASEDMAEAFELHGIVFWLAHSEGVTQARRDCGDWVTCDIPADVVGRPRALAALTQLCPSLASDLAGPARDWLHRMSQTVQVMPYMATAAE
nr:hypothetical protein [Paracoccus saliphilus]